MRASALLAILLVATLAARAPADDALEARRARVSALPPAEQQELLERQERFQALPPEEQERLRSLQSAIDADPNSERLQQVLARYHDWLKTLTPSQRAKLADLPVAERVAEIKRIQGRQQAAREREQRVELLSLDDMREVLRWIGDFVWNRRQGLVAEMSSESRQRFEKYDQQGQRRALVYRAFERSRREAGHGVLGAMDEKDIGRLAAKLSEPARQALESAGSVDEQRKLLGVWIGTSVHRSQPWSTSRKQNPLVVEELLQFLQNEVPPVDRERLLKLPREEMLRELRGLYFQRGRGERAPADGPRFDGRSRGGARLKSSRPGDQPTEKSSSDQKPADAAPADEKAPPAESPAAQSPADERQTSSSSGDDSFFDSLDSE